MEKELIDLKIEQAQQREKLIALREKVDEISEDIKIILKSNNDNMRAVVKMLGAGSMGGGLIVAVAELVRALT